MELEFVRWLRERLPQNDRVAVGPGDDAAVLHASSDRQTVVTTDMLMDGVDFVLGQCEPRLVGRKALAVNLSDLAAMAARPTAAFISLALPRLGGLDLGKSLYEGLIPLAQAHQVAIAGGDTNSWDGPLCISISALGDVPNGRAWLRSGARPGDELLVTGSLGGSILGKHFHFEPRIREALDLARDCEIHAAIDISDGLSLDLWRLCQESGCGAVVDLSLLPISPDAHLLASRDGIPPLDHALGDGEDFELLLAVPPEKVERAQAVASLTRIGRFVVTPGLWGREAEGTERPLTPRGFEH